MKETTVKLGLGCTLGLHVACVPLGCGCACHAKHEVWGKMGPEWKTAYKGA